VRYAPASIEIRDAPFDVLDLLGTGRRGVKSVLEPPKNIRSLVLADLWIQLDIAGVDIATADEGWVSKGASGYSVRALINLALAEAG
jgi:hypothetical protein